MRNSTRRSREGSGVLSTQCSLSAVAADVPACPEEPADICAKIGYECGGTFAEIGCGGEIDAVACGECAEGFSCREGSCACREEYECGTVEGSCGGAVSCGSCREGFECENFECVCAREPDVEVCARLDVDCGDVEAEDFCGNAVIASCGGCGAGICGENVCQGELEIAPPKAMSSSDAAATTGFGFQLTSAGDRVLVAAPFAELDGHADAGLVEVFSRNIDGSFGHRRRLVADEPAEDQRFGARLAASADGNLVAVSSANAVRLFRWEQDEYRMAVRIEPREAFDLDFATSVVVGEQRLAISSTSTAEAPASGKVDLYDLNGEYEATIEAPAELASDARFGQAVALSDAAIWISADRATVDGASDVGLVFRYDSPEATPEAFAPGDLTDGQRYGHRLDIAADNLLVGSHLDGGSESEAGTVYVLAREGGQWREIQQLRAPTPTANARFGHAIAASANLLFVGSYGAEIAFLYELDLDYRWKLRREVASPAGEGAWFGFRGAIAGDTLIVAAPRASDQGRLYAFGAGE